MTFSSTPPRRNPTTLAAPPTAPYDANARPRCSGRTRRDSNTLAATFSPPLVAPPIRNSGTNQPIDGARAHRAHTAQVATIIVSSATPSPPSLSARLAVSHEPIIIEPNHNALSRPNAVAEPPNSSRTR
jgi:hypothetical protein